MTAPSPDGERYRGLGTLFGIAGLLCFVAGLLWLAIIPPAQPLDLPAPQPHAVLVSGEISRMDSPALSYSENWTVDAHGADPPEPAGPWTEPAGDITFSYSGDELALEVAQGDYWGFFYTTVDGMPANRLPVIAGNTNSLGVEAGYKPLYAPELQQDGRPSAHWLTIHRSTTGGPHEVRIEVWRSWRQSPFRALAVDALPPPPIPVWPGVLLLVSGIGFWWSWFAVGWQKARALVAGGFVRLFERRGFDVSEPRSGYMRNQTAALIAMAMIGILFAATGSLTDRWTLGASGVAIIALAALARPALWIVAVVATLPFYFSFTVPLLPTRNVSLIDLGIAGGVVILALHLLMRRPSSVPRLVYPSTRWRLLLPVAIAGWALVSTSAARYTDVALDEWRLVFLAGALFGLTLKGVLSTAHDPIADRQLILWGWLGGSLLVATIGLWQFAAGSMLVQAEGVQRIRAFYGSPNNLALYLERTLAVLLALALFGKRSTLRWLFLVAVFVQATALLLTFSKGALFLAAPAMIVVLWLGGSLLLRSQGRSLRPLWILVGLAACGAIAVAPFLGAERFAGLFDLRQGTGFLRIQLWRSAWQMALDHPVFGVAPDNFLYHYRSDYILPAAWPEPNLNHPHNWMLDWWTRLGLPGLGLGLLFWGAGIALLIRRFRYGSGQDRPLALGFLAAAIAALAHGTIDLSYALPDLMIVWILLFGLLEHAPPGAPDD